MSIDVSSPFGLDPAITERLRALGPVLDSDAVAGSRALFAARRNLDLPPSGARHYDVAYGEHPRQKLDVCATPGRDRPVFLFVPGGGFTGGDKSAYLHVPSFFAREGFVGVAMNYRLAPEFGWPEGARDVASALDWIAGFIGDCGGDPRRIFVIAQSAGATHMASALLDPRFQPACLENIRAAVLMSGVYENMRDDALPGLHHYFGDDASEDRSPLNHAGKTAFAMTVTVSELDPPVFASQGHALAERLHRAGAMPKTLLLEGHNHLSPVLGLGSDGDELGPALVRDFASRA